ncbi:MAG: DUF4352 domain-containing protein [Flavobacteriales bacterium]|nr:DUF4352 domain-containing protein [Flavobacteriales bacterium]
MASLVACSTNDNSGDTTKNNLELTGLEKYNKNDYKGAIAAYDKHISQFPNDTSAYFNRARAKAMLGDFNGSLQDNTKSLKLDPTYQKAYYNRALDKIELDDIQGAIDDYTQLIDIKPDNLSEIYQKRGSQKNQLDDRIGALEDLTKALEIDPNNTDAYVSRALINMDNAPETAKLDLNKALELDKQNGSAYFVRGVVNLKLKNKQSGCSDLQQAIVLNYEPAKAYHDKYCVLPPNTHLLRDVIDFGNYTLQVTTFEEKAYYNSEFRPESSNKLVAVEFLMSNTGQSKIEYNALEFNLMDENSYEYKTVTFGFKNPYFSSGNIQPERKARGWITFEVPKESKKFEVKYTPGLFTGTTDYFIRLFDDIE